MAALEELRSGPEESARAQLAKALKERNNYLAGKAASIVAERQFQELVPNLAEAFERFLRDPIKSDPQCWAKNAIVKALKDLGADASEVFLKGVVHVQPEPVYGGTEDTAITLRGASGLALVNCRLSSFDILVPLTTLLGDPAGPVRVDAARAIAQLNAREGILPLRLSCLIGDLEAEPLGTCFAALLSLDAEGQLSFVARFLRSREPELVMEAVAALADCKEPGAYKHLKEFWDSQSLQVVKNDMLGIIAASVAREAADFLLWVVEVGSSGDAASALDALLRHRRCGELKADIERVLAERDSPELLRRYSEAPGGKG